VKVKTFTANARESRRYGPLHDKDGREFVVASARAARPISRRFAFKGVDDRNAAEALKGTELFVARDALPATG
jgi:16S rRNA processing protein RimM